MYTYSMYERGVKLIYYQLDVPAIEKAIFRFNKGCLFLCWVCFLRCHDFSLFFLILFGKEIFFNKT